MTDFFGDIHVNFPIAFILLIAVGPILFRAIKNRRYGIIARVEWGARESFAGKILDYLPLIFASLVILFSSLYFSGMRIESREIIQKRSGTDVIFVLDISKSMLAEDIRPNRINAAKSLIQSFVTRYTGGNLGLVIFAGKAFTNVPLTTDITHFNEAVWRVTIDSIKQELPGLSGTATGDGLLLAKKLFDSASGSTNDRSIILITDGEANMGVNPKTVSLSIRDAKIPVHSVGIGSVSGIDLYTTLPGGERQYFQWPGGARIHSSVDAELLSYISENTGGIYLNASDTASLEAAFRELGKHLKKEVLSVSEPRNIELSPLFFLAILFSLFGFLAVSIRRSEWSIL